MNYLNSCFQWRSFIRNPSWVTKIQTTTWKAAPSTPTEKTISIWTKGFINTLPKTHANVSTTSNESESRNLGRKWSTQTGSAYLLCASQEESTSRGSQDHHTGEKNMLSTCIVWIVHTTRYLLLELTTSRPPPNGVLADRFDGKTILRPIL